MAAQRLGQKKVRQLERRFGLRLDAVWSFGDQSWVHARTVAHRHVDLDRRSGTRVFYRDDEVGPGKERSHFDSCPDEAETERLRGGRPPWELDQVREIPVVSTTAPAKDAGQLVANTPRQVQWLPRERFQGRL